MYESIEDKTIKYILSNHDSLQENIHSRVIEYYKELGTVDEFIRSASLNHNGSEKLVGGDLDSIVWLYKKNMYDYEKEIKIGLKQLSEEQEHINRVWICYKTLPKGEYEMLTNLYVKGELYKKGEIESGLNHRKFEKVRKGAIDRIKELYESKRSNIDIIVNKGKEYEQLRLNL